MLTPCFQYSIFMLILMIIKLTLAILIFVKLDDIVAEVPQWLNEAFSRDKVSFQEIEKTVSDKDNFKKTLISRVYFSKK